MDTPGEQMPMMGRGVALLALAAFSAAVAHAAVPEAGTPEMAITFDDIPAHGPLPSGVDRLAVIDAITAALRGHGVTAAHGFLNTGFGDGVPDADAVIAHWRAAGYPLGNHGYSHMDLDRAGAPPFLADVIRNEPRLEQAMAGEDWHWLRYPFLHEGGSTADVAAVRNGLRARGYRIAAVTMSFSDYAWNEPYARCMAKGDAAAVAGLENSYLAAARSEAGRVRTLSRQLYGRDIPYVLLMHVGAFDAHMLPRLLDLYAELGFRFVPLAQAERDPFYAAATDLTLPGPSPTLEGAARSRGMAIPAAVNQPSATICT